jgi:ceramide glucosyltransferase
MLLMPLPPFTARVLLETVAAIGTAGGLFFYFLSAISMASFLRDRRKKLRQAPLLGSQLPAVSILKPLKGVDPEIWESFCSHCDQEYPQFQLIFGVSDSGDPVVEVVRKLQAKYPNLAIELIVCDRVLGANIKVSNLAQMLPAARHELFLVNDSDIRVPSDYLRKVIAPLAEASVGLVTCLYRGVAGPTAGRATLGSRLEALGISTDFVPGVLSARFLEKGLHFGLGSTLAFRRRDLEAIGGFEALLDYLADDYELGRRIAAMGKRVELSTTTVVTFLPAYTLRQFFRHQLRWSRTIRDARRWGYAGLLFTFGVPWALLTLLAAGGAAWAWALLALTFAVRLTVGVVAGVGVLHDRRIFRNELFRNIFLLALRDLIAPFVWAAGFMGNRIHWRGGVFNLKHGRLTIVKPA